MAQTPAWPPASLTRLFVDQPLADNATVLIEGGQAHYLSGVMRLKPGDHIGLFDDVSGEWRAEIEHVAKRHVQLKIDGKIREREDVPDLWLLAAPIKKGRIDWMAEKACELGVARFQPVITQRTVVDRVKLDRLRAHMIEAAEQCERADGKGGEAGSRRYPDRPRGRLHRGGTRGDQGCATGSRRFARPAHLARRHGDGGSSRIVDGIGRRLALSGCGFYQNRPARKSRETL
jgi:hypothetical protein